MANYAPIDADGHITETVEQLVPYLENPRHVEYGRDHGRVARPRFYPTDAWDRGLGGRLGANARTGEDWARVCDESGLEYAFLYPTEGLGIGCVREPELAVSLCRAYNNFLSEEFMKRDRRLIGIALLPLQDVAEAVKELRRVVTELNIPGAMLPAVGLRAPLGDPQFHPIYSEAERLDVMLGVHATVREPSALGAAQFDRFIEVHQLSHPFAQMQQMTSMIFQGVLEQYPGLRIAFMEAGCTWVPYWLNRMDTEWEMRGDVEAPRCKRKPSEYVQSGRVFFHAEEDEQLIPQTAATLREDIFYYASDYPHWDHHFPDSMAEFQERADLGESLRRWILRDTALRMYGMD